MVAKENQNRHGSRIEVEIERLAHGGDGVGKQLNGEAKGRVVFVPKSCPGDRLSVELTASKKRFARGSIVDILEPGPGRVEPECAYFPLCGGCSWQHVSLPVQREALSHGIQFGFRALLNEKSEILPIRVGAGTGYRQRLRLHALWRPSGFVLGFRESGGRRVVPIRDCVVATAALRAHLSGLVEILEKNVAETRGEGSVVLLEDGLGDVLLSVKGPWLPTLKAAGLKKGFAGVSIERDKKREFVGKSHGEWPVEGCEQPLRVKNGDFAQANTEIVQQLVGDLAGELALLKPQRVLELFCGSGTLTLPLATDAIERWTAVDSVEDAVESLRDRYATDQKMKWFVASRPSELPRHMGTDTDLILMDPPREGAADWMDFVAGQNAATILYVSCDYMTQVRDIAELSAHGYQITRLYSYDMFPHTGHVETLAVLQKGESHGG